MLDRAERRFNLKPKRLAADTAYGSGRFLGWLVDRGVAPHIPVRDASERDDGTFSRSDFRWDGRQGVYICPNNKVLHTTGRVHDGNMLRYRPPNSIAISVRSKCNVAPMCPHDRSRVMSMRMPATWPAA